MPTSGRDNQTSCSKRSPSIFQHAEAQLTQLEKHGTGGDIKALTTIAHTLKSSSAQLGAHRLAGLYAKSSLPDVPGKPVSFPRSPNACVLSTTPSAPSCGKSSTQSGRSAA